MKDELKYVKKSKYRTGVIKSIEEYPKMPSQIARDCEIAQNHISNTLKQLKEIDLVECMNPEVKKGRLYRLTDKGEKIAEKLETNE
ncbi:winged helix-turn-helix domain-containing protein [Methanobrevibacter sp.]|uniref:winged helix-turn-helix domain-containing protein n=1 Tax=Methanobrevibacter sp. TaxID=66852 RepID=UPI0038670AD4